MRVTRIAGSSGAVEGEFGGDGLAEDDRAGGFQALHDFGIHGWAPAGKRRRAAFGGKAGGVDDVFDADGDTVQRTERLAGGAGRIGCFGLSEREVGLDVSPGPDDGLAEPNAAQTVIHQVDTGQPAGDYFGMHFTRGQSVKIIHRSPRFPTSVCAFTL